MAKAVEQWVAIRANAGRWDVDTASGRYVAMNVSEEHARLIAAAPDLFAALARLANELEMPGERGVLHSLPGALAEARKALAKAEGCAS